MPPTIPFVFAICFICSSLKFLGWWHKLLQQEWVATISFVFILAISQNVFSGHCDTIQLALDQGKQINDTKLNFNIVQAPQPSIQMMAAFIHPKYENAFERAKQIIEYFYNQQQKFTKQINTITTKKDLEQTINQKKVGAILTIENGRAIENKIENVDYFYGPVKEKNK